MNYTQRRERFDEVVFAIRLLDPDEEMPKIPRGCEGLGDPHLKQALVCQALKEDHGFQLAFMEAFTYTAMNEIVGEDGAIGSIPSADMLGALGIALNVAWAIGAYTIMLNLCGVAGSVKGSFPSIELPTDFQIIFRPNGSADEFNALDPYRLLGGVDAYTTEEIVDLAEKANKHHQETHHPDNTEALTALLKKLTGE